MKTVLMTGGAKRLGLALVNAFLEEGWRVICHHHSTLFDPALLTPAAAAQQKNLSTFQYELGQVIDTASAHRFLEKATQDQFEIDVLINNASEFNYDKPGDFNASLFQSAISVNLQAPISLMDAFLTKNAQHQRTVINLLDSKLLALNMDYLSYSVSKAGLEAATKMYAIAFEGVAKIYGVAPSMFLESGPQTVGRVEELTRLTLTQKPVDITDIVSTIKFLTTGALQSGEIVPVNGGQHVLGFKRDVAFLNEKDIS